MNATEYKHTIIKYGMEISFNDIESSFVVSTPIGTVEYFKTMDEAIDYAKYIDDTH